MKPEHIEPSHYRGHVLNCHPAVQEDGRFQARVAIARTDNDAPFSQRFLDLEICQTRELAVQKARQAGVAWVDRECGSRNPGASATAPAR